LPGNFVEGERGGGDQRCHLADCSASQLNMGRIITGDVGEILGKSKNIYTAFPDK
jgi:hypothetical protein